MQHNTENELWWCQTDALEGKFKEMVRYMCAKLGVLSVMQFLLKVMH